MQQYFGKLHDALSLSRLVNIWKLKSEKVVFTNGCFDVLHPGHIMYLNEAWLLGHRLVVAVNTDSSVKRLGKDPSRPVNDEYFRLSMLSALKCVDALILFDEATPFELIEQLQPDILVKGGDYNPSETNITDKSYIVGSNETKSRGGQVTAIPLLEGYSTTSLLAKWRTTI